MGRYTSHGEASKETPPKERSSRARMAVALRRVADDLADRGPNDALASLLRSAAYELDLADRLVASGGAP
ncbi:MAG: hypothetical protein GEU73_14465 [Chloroflexi bacterium]|nr:hypothetical protein [Chloroflexota bacterium]